MAWKGNPTNPVPNVVQKSEVLSEKKVTGNRAENTRRDTDTQKDFTVRLIDVDTAIMKQLERFQLNVVDEGARIKVPTFYASPEKWKSIQKDGYFRDYNGKIQLPAIVFQRTTSDKDQALMMFNRYLKYPVIKLFSEKNRYTPFNVLVGLNVPVNEVYDVVVPDHMVFTYHFIIWTEYVEQMNTLVERMNFETDDYWGDARGFRFRTNIESFSHAIELQVDQDRMVKTEFDLVVHGYLLPDSSYGLDGSKPTTKKWFTPKKIVMGEEVVTTDFDMSSFDPNKEKWRRQDYPNLQKDVVIPPPPISIQQPAELIPSSALLLSQWQFPAPTNSSDPGEEGWISYDTDYYYIYVGGSWRRAPKALVLGIQPLADQISWSSYDNDYIYLSGAAISIPMSLFNNF
jgi:hypothetical protein